jgi:hypothetical protein
LVSEKAIEVSLVAGEESASQPEKWSRKSTVMPKTHGKLTATAVQKVQL